MRASETGLRIAEDSPHSLFSVSAVDGRSLVIRSCGWVDPNDGGRSACTQLSTPGYIHQEYCSICNSDGCNPAVRHSGSMAALLAAPLVAIAAWLRH